MRQPLISVIIPIYNTGEKAVRLLNRLVRDSYDNLELICVNDGSTDDSILLLKEFCRQYKLSEKKTKTRQKKIILISQENAGPAAARNIALEKATGKYVAFIDSDDAVSPKYLTEMSKLLSSEKVLLSV